MVVAKEETFAPLAPVFRFKSADDEFEKPLQCWPRLGNFERKPGGPPAGRSHRSQSRGNTICAQAETAKAEVASHQHTNVLRTNICIKMRYGRSGLKRIIEAKHRSRIIATAFV